MVGALGSTFDQARSDTPRDSSKIRREVLAKAAVGEQRGSPRGSQGVTPSAFFPGSPRSPSDGRLLLLCVRSPW